MITGKQRSELKKLAQEIKPTVMIGKEELTPAVIAAIDDYLAKHELVKVQIQDGAILDPKETAGEVAGQIGAEFVQVIGHKFVLYRQASDPDKEMKKSIEEGAVMGAPIVEIDLHGMFQDEAVKVIDKALQWADSGTYQIKLIHGYHRGTGLKNMIADEYKYHPKVLRIQPGDNMGNTILVLREL